MIRAKRKRRSRPFFCFGGPEGATLAVPVPVGGIDVAAVPDGEGAAFVSAGGGGGVLGTFSGSDEASEEFLTLVSSGSRVSSSFLSSAKYL